MSRLPIPPHRAHRLHHSRAGERPYEHDDFPKIQNSINPLFQADGPLDSFDLIAMQQVVAGGHS
ncbi:MAG: hypothetical protein L0287_05080, partial [Anaerolineae bacterium]|nr:hypothetical protein [Anaerolineae bacterium]